MLRYDRILIDHGLNLDRAEGEALLGQLVDDDAAIVGRIAFRPHPGDHVIPALGGEGGHYKVAQRFGAGQAHQQIIRLEVHRLPGILLLGQGPEILLVVEHLGVGHVVVHVAAGLDGEEVFGIAQMAAQICGEIAQWLEHPRKRLAVYV